jgi:hypothetical protein
MRKAIGLICLGIISFTIFNYLNLKYAVQVTDLLYRDLVGNIFIKASDDKTITIIEYEMINGHAKKIDLSLESIDINSFHNADTSAHGPILYYEDNNYLYTIHDGEDKVIYRTKK